MLSSSYSFLFLQRLVNQKPLVGPDEKRGTTTYGDGDSARGVVKKKKKKKWSSRSRTRCGGGRSHVVVLYKAAVKVCVIFWVSERGVGGFLFQANACLKREVGLFNVYPLQMKDLFNVSTANMAFTISPQDYYYYYYFCHKLQGVCFCFSSLLLISKLKTTSHYYYYYYFFYFLMSLVWTLLESDDGFHVLAS